MAPNSDPPQGAHTLPRPELNPLLNPILADNMGRWAEVYFKAPQERREEAVLELIRELEAERSQQAAIENLLRPAAASDHPRIHPWIECTTIECTTIKCRKAGSRMRLHPKGQRLIANGIVGNRRQTNSLCFEASQEPVLAFGDWIGNLSLLHRRPIACTSEQCLRL